MCGIVDAGHRFGLRIVVRVKLPRTGLRQAVGTGAGWYSGVVLQSMLASIESVS
ncbi:hypothetical protein LMG19089_03459 [Ralstonia edaphis]|nr:hypothetical protein LMG19089_03459 [Ralstonia sp. LMG 6871]